MNKLMIIGNVCNDPQSHQTTTGKTVCNFTVAANRKKKVQGQPEADFFRVAAWDTLGELCQKYLTKGKKCCVIGPVSVSTYQAQDGTMRANLEVFANEVEFLTPANQAPSETPVQETAPAEATAAETAGQVVDTDELPF